MKILFAILVSILFTSCFNWDAEQKDFETFFKGNHQLRKLSQQEKTTYAFSGSYFLFWGDIHGGSNHVRYVGFSWKGINDEYILSQIPVEKVRIKLDTIYKMGQV